MAAPGGGGQEGLDEDTVAALTMELAKLADRIDVACIAHSSGAPPARARFAGRLAAAVMGPRLGPAPTGACQKLDS